MDTSRAIAAALTPLVLMGWQAAKHWIIRRRERRTYYTSAVVQPLPRLGFDGISRYSDGDASQGGHGDASGKGS